LDENITTAPATTWGSQYILENRLGMAVTERRLILVNHLLEPPGRITGITRFLFALLSELIRRPHFRYALVTTWAADELPPALRHGNLAVIGRPFRHSTPLNVVAQTLTMGRLMRATNAALEFNGNPLGGLYPGWPRVVTVHDLYFDVMGAHYPRHHRLWWDLFFPLTLASSAGAVCVSEATRSDLAKYYGHLAKKATVIHEAGALIHEGTAHEFSRVRAPYAIYVGNISPNKNPALLVAALKILRARGTALSVVHVGRDELTLLSSALTTAGLTTSVETINGLSDAELAAAYRGAQCLVVTSTYEGFCLPVVEAQALGVPVICSDIAVLREVAGEGALFVDPYDADALAGQLNTVMIDPALRARLSRAGRRNAGRFSWRRAAAEAEVLFKRLIEADEAEIRKKKHGASPIWPRSNGGSHV
jgi:glycosyltransferase involved in cell wall biosynthesis